MKSQFLVLFSVILVLLGSKDVQAQKPLNPTPNKGPVSIVEVLNANLQEGVNLSETQTTTFTGNVIFRHEGVLMGCDKAFQNTNSNTVEAFGNIKINQGDTLTIVGDSLYYEGNTRVATIWGKKVILRDKKVTLRTKKVIYNIADGMAFYPVFGEIMQDSSKLTSQKGYYNTRTKYFNYIGDVEIINPDFVLCTDTMDYDTYSKLAIFKAYTTVKSKNGELSAEKGTYNISTKESNFFGRSKVVNEKYSLEGDTLRFDNTNDYGWAKGNVVFISKKDRIISVGNEGIRLGKDGYTKINGETITKLISDKDTAYLAADTLRIIEKGKTESERILAKIKLDSITTEKINLDSTITDSSVNSLSQSTIVPILPKTLIIKDPILVSPTLKDSTAKSEPSRDDVHLVIAEGKVKIYRDDLQSISDSLVYNAIDSTISYFKNPYLWHKKNQLKADTILVHLRNNKLKQLDLKKNGFIIEEYTLFNLNQIKGRNISSFFNDSSQVELIDIYGNAEYKYYLLDEENKIIGLDMVQCSSIKFLFKNEELQKIKYFVDCEGSLVPPQDIRVSESKFNDFDYRITEKPSKKSIIDLKHGKLLEKAKLE